MQLEPGTLLGHYEILSPLGAGGMGEVYRARDTRLGREVAIKVLPADLGKDEDRMRRFEQEARAAGALNHPNILAVHDLGTHEGFPYLVTELLNGETLRERLKESPLPERKALSCALQIASGLSAAHEKGIVHRDVKPENLFLAKGGQIKILDFGLAKVSSVKMQDALPPDSPTFAVETGVGVVMGTPGYMSPEQVTGRTADHRSDIFSFGAVLYEMLSGRRAFQGNSAVETMSATLREDPAPFPAGQTKIPMSLERVIRRCMEKQPEERFQSMRDVAFSLEALSDPSGALTREQGVSGAGRRRKNALGAVVLATAIIGASALLLGMRINPGVQKVSYRQITFQRGTVYTARFAPDGKTVVYSAAWEGRPNALYSTNTDTTDSRPFGIEMADVVGVSPSQEIAILQRKSLGFGPGVLARLPLAGGSPRDLLEGVSWADWCGDDEDFPVVRAGGQKDGLEFPVGKKLYEPPGFVNYPRLSPGKDLVAFLDHPSTSDGGKLIVIDRAGKRRVLSEGWSSIEGVGWRPDGKEVWFTAARTGLSSALYGVSLSGKERLLLRAPGRLVLHDVSPDGKLVSERNSLRCSILGHLTGDSGEEDHSWLDFSLAADISTDGQTLLFSESGEAAGDAQLIYLRKNAGSTPIRLGNGVPMGLSPDGKWALAISSDSDLRLVLFPTGAGEVKHLAVSGLKGIRWAGWFPSGDKLLLLGNEEGKGARLYAMELSGGAPRSISSEGLSLRNNTISPDGKWVVAIQNGVVTLFPLGGGEPRPLAGIGQGEQPLKWHANGREIFVRETGALPAKVFLLDVASGQRKPWREFMPTDCAGVLGVYRIVITPDGASYAYSAARLLSDLYVIEGIK